MADSLGGQESDPTGGGEVVFRDFEFYLCSIVGSHSYELHVHWEGTTHHPDMSNSSVVV